VVPKTVLGRVRRRQSDNLELLERVPDLLELVLDLLERVPDLLERVPDLLERVPDLLFHENESDTMKFLILILISSKFN